MKIFNAKYCYGWILILSALCIQLLSPLHAVLDDHNHGTESSDLVDHCSACTAAQQIQSSVFYCVGDAFVAAPLTEFLDSEVPELAIASEIEFLGFNFSNKAPPVSI